MKNLKEKMLNENTIVIAEQYTNKEIINVLGFVPKDIKAYRSHQVNKNNSMPKNPRPEYKSHFSQ
jgi:hypothetical protein